MSRILAALLFIFAGRTNVVSPDEIKSVVYEYVISCLDSSLRKDAVVEFRSLPGPVRLSDSEYTLRVGSESTPRLRGNVSLPVEIVSQGNILRLAMVSIRVTTFGNALLARHRLERHTKVSDADCEVARVELSSAPADLVANASQLTGKRTRKMILPGSMLRESALEIAPSVVQDEAVTLTIRTKRVILSTSAVAKEDGLLGRVIRVQKTNSHQQIEAKVVGEHKVEIAME